MTESVPARRQLLMAGAIGAAPGLVLATWMLTAGTWRVFGWHPAADFYDAQAHALLGGHLDMPRSVLGIEAFVVHGRAYMYQGPFPALLRLPVAALTDRLDGRLAVLSMLVALVVAAAATTALTWQARRLVRGIEPARRREQVAVAGFVFACTGGAVPLAIASQVSVYHEAAMWGLATGLATLAVLVRHLSAPRRWTLPVASALTVACLGSRASVGLGMAVALGMVFLGELAAWWHHRRGRSAWPVVAMLRPARPAAGWAVLAALVACVAPVLLYTALNVAKFGTAVSVPWDKQVFVAISDDRREFLEVNHGTFFGAQFVPSTAVAYLRPDAFHLETRFPWIGFRTGDIGRRHLTGTTVFDRVDATGSIPVSFPLLDVLAVVGLVAVVRGRRRSPGPALLWGPLVGAGAAAASIFVFGFVALRYLGDALPLLVVAGAIGLASITTGLRSASSRRAVPLAAALVLLGVLGTAVNVGQGLWYQRVYASPADPQATHRFFERRGGGDDVTAGAHLPSRGRPGALFVLGDCDGLYVSDGATVDSLSHTNWKPVATTDRVGAYDLDVTFPAAPVGTADPLLVSGRADQPNILRVEYLAGDRVRIGFHGAGFGDGEPVHVTSGRTYHVLVALDPETDLGYVTISDRRVFSGGYTADDLPVLGVNRLDTSTRPRFGGSIRRRPESRSLCRDVAARAGISVKTTAAARTGTGTRTASG